MIPFVLGIITVIEGLASACMPTPLDDSEGEDNDGSSSFVQVDAAGQDGGQDAEDWTAQEARFHDFSGQRKKEGET